VPGNPWTCTAGSRPATPRLPAVRSASTFVRLYDPTSHCRWATVSEPQLPLPSCKSVAPIVSASPPVPSKPPPSSRRPLIPPHPGLLLPGEPSRRPEPQPRSRTSRGSWHFAGESLVPGPRIPSPSPRSSLYTLGVLRSSMPSS
jgi:hypothetical protein